MRWRRVLCAFAALAFLQVEGYEGDGRRPVSGESGSVKARLDLLWPIHFTSVPLSSPHKSSLEPSDFGNVLAKIGVDRFEDYKNATLPKELELDKRFSVDWEDADHSRLNTAFRRWQMRVFADRMRVSPMTLSGRGERAPRLPGIDYNWNELYDNPAHKRLLGRIDQLSRLYIKRSNGNAPKKFRIFTWVEVYGKGDAHRPMSRTDGAFLMGRYFATVSKGGLKLNFEDPRGINPPYGKTFSFEAYEGSIVLYPTWVSHFITPNMHDKTAVMFCFIVYPPDGNTQDWEDDATGNLEVARALTVPRDLPSRKRKKDEN